MEKLITWIKKFWAAFIAAPIVAPLLDILRHRTTLSLMAGMIAYVLIPQIQGLTPDQKTNLGNFAFIGTLLLSGRFTLEGIMQTRAGLPQTTEDYLKALLTELLNPAPDTIVNSTTAIANGANTAVVSQWQSSSGLSGGTIAIPPAPRPTLPLSEQAEAG